jgi:GTP-binding protein LepA
VMEVDNPTKFPPPASIQKIEEPMLTAMIITSEESVGGVLQLCEEKRGAQKKFEYLSPTRIMLTYEMPLNEIVLDFYDRLKSVSRGYASLDYHLSGYHESDLVKLDVLVGGEPVDALTVICHRDQSYERGRDLVSRLRKLIPRQMFEIAIQAAIGSRVIARETISPIRNRQMLRRRHFPQTQTPRKAKRRQKTHETCRPRGHPPGSLPRGSESFRRHCRRGVRYEGRTSANDPDDHRAAGCC